MLDSHVRSMEISDFPFLSIQENWKQQLLLSTKINFWENLVFTWPGFKLSIVASVPGTRCGSGKDELSFEKKFRISALTYRNNNLQQFHTIFAFSRPIIKSSLYICATLGTEVPVTPSWCWLFPLATSSVRSLCSWDFESKFPRIFPRENLDC